MLLRPGDPVRFTRAWLEAIGLNPETAANRARGVVVAVGSDSVTARWGTDVVWDGPPCALELALRERFSSKPPAHTEAA